MSYKCDDFKPSLHGTWAAAMPREFYYCPEREHYEPKHESCGLCCNGGPCCNGGICCPCEKEEHEEEHCEHHEHHECHEHECCCTAVNANTGGAGPLGIIAALASPINVVSTTINTCCIGTTNNLITFTTNISIPVALVATLNFQVVRSSCVGSPVPIGSTFTYAETVAALTTRSFSFSFLDTNVAPGTYTYTVQLVPGTTITVAGLAILNATLSVTATAVQG